MAVKTDFKKTLDAYRAPMNEFRVVEIPAMRYLMVDGHGDPNSDADYTAAVEALFPVAYRLKFLSKNELGHDYVVPPLEGLWWAGDMEAFTDSRDKSHWDWTMMILVPDWLSETHVHEAVQRVRAKRPPLRLESVRFETLEEGLCVQTLHLGSFDDEGPVLKRLHHEFVPANKLVLTGKHHEVYFSDPRKTAPEKLRTLLRQPVARATV